MLLSTTSGSLRAPQLLDVVLDPGITGVGTDGVALYGDEDNSRLEALAAGLIIICNPLTREFVGNVVGAALCGVVRSSCGESMEGS